MGILVFEVKQMYFNPARSTGPEQGSSPGLTFVGN
jgi:hypothetical protein